MSLDVRSLVSVGICANVCILWHVYGYIFQYMRSLRYLWIYFPGWYVSELFWLCVLGVWALWPICWRYVAGYKDCSVWGCMSQSVRSLLCLWVYVWVVRSLKCLWVQFPRCKFPELFMDVYSRKWNLWSICDCMFQNVRSQCCLSLYMSQYVRSLLMGVYQGYMFSDTFVLVLPREWGLWGVWGGRISYNVSSQICLWLYDLA